MVRILIVDDNELVTKSLAQSCRLIDYSIEWTKDARSAYTKIQSHHYDVVIIDPSEDNPVRGNRTLSDILVEDYPNIIRICHSGHNLTEDLPIQAQYQEIIVKGLGYTERLVKAIEKYFPKRAT
jgi:DNA-binding NtrC family response regulator